MEKVRHSVALAHALVNLCLGFSTMHTYPLALFFISFNPVIGSRFTAHQSNDGWQRCRIAYKIIILDETKLYAHS